MFSNLSHRHKGQGGMYLHHMDILRIPATLLKNEETVSIDTPWKKYLLTNRVRVLSYDKGYLNCKGPAGCKPRKGWGLHFDNVAGGLGLTGLSLIFRFSDKDFNPNEIFNIEEAIDATNPEDTCKFETVKILTTKTSTIAGAMKTVFKNLGLGDSGVTPGSLRKALHKHLEQLGIIEEYVY